MSLYGTRDTAVNFQKEVKELMTKTRYVQGRYNPCTYWHGERDLKTLVHGDDFVTEGSGEEAAWLRARMEERFDIKTKTIGTGKEETKEERILNRVIRITKDGWEHKPDQRHAELIVCGLGLEDAKEVAMPWEEGQKWDEEEHRKELDGAKLREFRTLAARANYLAVNRPDIQFATKEICRGMARPKLGDWHKPKRLGRYVLGGMRTVMTYPWQGEETEIA